MLYTGGGWTETGLHPPQSIEDEMETVKYNIGLLLFFGKILWSRTMTGIYLLITGITAKKITSTQLSVTTRDNGLAPLFLSGKYKLLALISLATVVGQWRNIGAAPLRLSR